MDITRQPRRVSEWVAVLDADGPIWAPHWETYQGKRVLIIEIDPPRWGDPIHCFRRQIGNIRDGMPYVRGMARSFPADHTELARLAQRFAARTPEQLDIDVSCQSGPALSKYGWDAGQLDRYLEILREDLMKPLIEERTNRPAPHPYDFDVSRVFSQLHTTGAFSGTWSRPRWQTRAVPIEAAAHRSVLVQSGWQSPLSALPAA
jgi:hypothetical protein